MSLAGFLLVNAIKGTVEITRSVASSPYAARAAADIVTSVATIKQENRLRAEANKPKQMPVQNTASTYDVDLFLAKVAMLSYIAKADKVISEEESSVFEQTLSVAEKMYGRSVASKARRIFEAEGGSFLALEPYLQKVNDSDLDSFLFYSEEYANADNKLTVEEDEALKKLR